MDAIFRTISIIVPNATVAGTRTASFVADNDYDLIDGVAVCPRKGTDLFDMGFKDTAKIYVDVSPMELYEFTGSSRQDHKFFDVQMKGNGNTITITYNLLANAATDNTISVTFRLKRTKTDCQ